MQTNLRMGIGTDAEDDARDYTLRLAIAFANGHAQLQTAFVFFPVCLPDEPHSRLVRPEAQRGLSRCLSFLCVCGIFAARGLLPSSFIAGLSVDRS